MNKYRCLCNCTILVLVAICIPVVWWCIGLYMTVPWEDHHTELFLPENVTYWEFKKSVWSEWKWRYTLQNREVIDGKSLTISHRCPSSYDADLWLGSDFMASTKTTDSRKIYLKAGGGYKFAHLEFARWWDLSLSGFYLNMNVYDELGEKIADVDDKNQWWNGNEHEIEFSDENGTIAYMVHNQGFLARTWEIFVMEDRTDVLDPRMLALMAGKLSFAEDSEKTDMCNDYVQFIFGTAGAILGFIILYCVCKGYSLLKNCVCKGCSLCKNMCKNIYYCSCCKVDKKRYNGYNDSEGL